MTKAKFFQRESLFKPTYVEHEVGSPPESMRFYPLSINMLWKMRHAVEPLVGAFVALTAGKNDFEKTVDQGVDEETGERRVVTHMGAVKPEIAKMREDRREKSLQGAVDAMFAPKMRSFIGEMLTDSLRDDFTRVQARDPAVIKEMMEGSDDAPGLDLGTLGEMIAGLVKANARVFGPFQGRIREVMSDRVQNILDDASGPGRSADLGLSEFEDSDLPESERPQSEKAPDQSERP